MLSLHYVYLTLCVSVRRWVACRQLECQSVCVDWVTTSQSNRQSNRHFYCPQLFYLVNVEGIFVSLISQTIKTDSKIIRRLDEHIFQVLCSYVFKATRQALRNFSVWMQAIKHPPWPHRLLFDVVPPGVDAGDDGCEAVAAAAAGCRAFRFRFGDNNISGAAATASGKLTGRAGTAGVVVVVVVVVDAVVEDEEASSPGGEERESAGEEGADMNSGFVISSGNMKSVTSLLKGSSSNSFNASKLYLRKTRRINAFVYLCLHHWVWCSKG